MTVFVDGYNLIFAASRKLAGFDISRTEAARKHLIALLAKFKSVRADRIVVFFDGGLEAAGLPRRTFAGGMEIVFSEAKSDADTDIKNAVSHADDPRQIRVVSSDAAIRNFVARYGAQVTDSREFLAEIEAALEDNALPADEPIEKYEGGADGEIDYWMRIFGEPDDDEKKG